MTPQQKELLEIGRKSLRNEISTLERIESTLDTSFIQAVEMILECRGKIILTGMGKSGHIARKIAATLTSTGTPALFLHPAEASHGDLGIIAAGDVVVVLSYSGETNELRDVVTYATKNNNPIIAITGSATSSLAKHANIHLDIMVTQEDCVLNIVPTSSTTAQLALGDALASSLMYARSFRAEDFAHLHPGGYIDRRMSLKENNE